LKREALNYTLWRIDFERGWRLILLLCKEWRTLVSGAQWRCDKYRGGKMQDGTSLSAADGVQPGCHLAHLLIWGAPTEFFPQRQKCQQNSPLYPTEFSTAGAIPPRTTRRLHCVVLNLALGEV
jgi:hypothetical protein